MSIYLDYNATTPLLPTVKETIINALEIFGNPSSGHGFGQAALEAVNLARTQVANMLQVDQEELTFVSCGSESVNSALKGVALGALESGAVARPHVVTTAIEHPCVMETCSYLQSRGCDVTFVPVDSQGRVCVDDIVAAITPSTVLVSVMFANNEIGSVNPIAAIAAAVRALPRPDGAPAVLVHTDASQAVGKIEVHPRQLGVDLLSLAGHKFYAPKGVAALYVRSGTPPLLKLIHGGGHEGGRRAGTESTVLLSALGAAAQAVTDGLQANMAKTGALRTLLCELLCENGQGISAVVNGPAQAEQRLPNTLSISFPGSAGPCVLARMRGRVAASCSAACHSGDAAATALVGSAVLRAMAVPPEVAVGTLRLSVGVLTTEAEVRDAAAVILESVQLELASSAKTATAAASCCTEDVQLATVGENKAGEGGEEKRDPLVTDCLYMQDSTALQATVAVVSVDMDGGEGVCGRRKAEVGLVAVATAATVMHPQGGGQPADVGTITSGSSGSVFNVQMVRLDRATSTVYHYGSFLPPTTAFAVGEMVTQCVDGDARMTNARLHSGGHLLDAAMKLAGVELKPGRGHHFPGQCYVEYIGSIAAPERAALKASVQEHVNALIAQAIPTSVHYVPVDEVAALCHGGTADTDHLPQDKPIRVVCIAGKLGCPCGGTHVLNSADIGSLTITKLQVKKGKTKLSYTVESPSN